MVDSGIVKTCDELDLSSVEQRGGKYSCWQVYFLDFFKSFRIEKGNSLSMSHGKDVLVFGEFNATNRIGQINFLDFLTACDVPKPQSFVITT